MREWLPFFCTHIGQFKDRVLLSGQLYRLLLSEIFRWWSLFCGVDLPNFRRLHASGCRAGNSPYYVIYPQPHPTAGNIQHLNSCDQIDNP